jgi:Ca2+-binding EF-hand superfamily protein
MTSFYNFRNIKIQENKKDIDNTLNSNSIYYTHYNTDANTNPNTNINSFNISLKNYNENQTILSNYINQNQYNEITDILEEIKTDESEPTNGSKIIDEDAPTNIDEIIKNEISTSIIDSFLNQHQIKSIPMFILYLSEIWQELSKETNPPEKINKGINLFSFNKYYNLPGLIGQRLFEILDVDNNGFLSPKEFITGMCTLFCEEINSLIKFIFNFCDFDRDKYITFDDIHAVLSYLPIINGFDDMIDIEEEIYSTIQDIFINKKEKIDYNTFFDLIIRKERYELFVPLISFFYENKPFNNEEINEFYKEYYDIGKINDKEGNYQISKVINLKEYENKNEEKNKYDNAGKNNIYVRNN